MTTGELLCLIPGPSVVLRTDADDRPTRWCFTCRKHVPHTWVLLGDPPSPLETYYLREEGMDGYAQREVIHSLSYYDPSWSLRCPAGHSDTYFPGCDPL